MQTSRSKQYYLLLFFALLLPLLCYFHLFAGKTPLNLSDYTDALFSFDSDNSKHIIAREFRIPRLFLGLLAGAALSVSGLFMQTMFNNPLAGPYILGINSGSSLFVACSIMTGIPLLSTTFGTITSSFLGALVFGFIILSFSYLVRSHISLLLIGMMIGSFTASIVSVIQAWSDPNELKQFTLWSMGSLQQAEFSDLSAILAVFLLGCLGALLMIKPLNTLILGETQAQTLGIEVKKIRLLLITITALLTGLTTAYCGPIAFVGLAVPNLVKMIFKTQNHALLITGCLLIGAAFLVLCDCMIQWLESSLQIPINALTSLLGAPFVIFIVLKRLT